MAHIRKGDTVVVTTGKDKGKRGKVLKLEGDRVVVEKVNMVKRHTKPNQKNPQGGIVEREAPIHISNVMPWCDAANGPSKIVMKTLENGSRVRTWKINGETLDD